MSKITIGVRVQISLEDIESLLDSASRGSAYWCEDVSELAYESAVKAIMDGKMIMLHDAEEDGKAYELTLAKVKKGIAIMAKKETRHFADLVLHNADQITADVLLQCALFGEVIYG